MVLVQTSSDIDTREAERVAAAYSVDSMLAAISAQASARGVAIAVADEQSSLTYDALVRGTDVLAARIGQLADGGAPIGVMVPNSPAYVVAILALLQAGRIVVPMDPGAPDARNRRIVEHSGMAAMIVDAGSAATAEHLAPDLPRIPVPDAEEPLPPTTGLLRRGAANPLFSITYTSGSTGEPKGVCKASAGLFDRVERAAVAWRLDAANILLLTQSLSGPTAVTAILATLATGGRVVILDLKRLGLGAATALMARHRPTVCVMVPSLFRALFAPDTAEVHRIARGVKCLQIGGEPVRHVDVDLYRRRFGEETRLLSVLGSAEGGRYAAWEIGHGTVLDRPLVPVGYPLPHMEMMLVDDDGAPVAAGEIGEIVIGGPALAIGYWRDAALTGDRFVTYPDGRVRYRTGDFGRLLPDGLLEFVGRRDRQVKVLGNTVHLAEVEAAIARCPAVREVSVVARTEAHTTRLVAYCIGNDAVEATVRQWCREQLAPAMRPAIVTALDQLPQLPGGKVDLVTLARIDAEHARRADTESGPTPVDASPAAEAVRACWSRFLGAGSYRADMSFEESGGDSLKAMELLLALEQRFARKLPLELIGPDLRPSQIPDRLRVIDAGRAVRKHRERPHVVLIPDLFAADFVFSAFAARLGTGFDVQVIDQRDASAEPIGEIDAEAFFALVGRKVSEAGPPGRLWLMGHGAGSRIAVEAARRLIAHGIAVERVVLLDGSAPAASVERKHRIRERPVVSREERIAAHGGLARFIATRLALRPASAALHHGAFRMLRRYVALLAWIGLKQAATEVIGFVLKQTRNAAFRDLPRGPLPMPVTLVASLDMRGERHRNADRGWGDICTGVDVIELACTRPRLLHGEHADLILAELEELAAKSQPHLSTAHPIASMS